MNVTRTILALFLATLLALPCAQAWAKPGGKDKQGATGKTAKAGADADDADAMKADADDTDSDSDDAADDDKNGANANKAKGAVKKPAVDPGEPGTIEGMAMDKKKVPLAGATVVLFGKKKGDKDASNIDETTVGPDGSFTLTGPPGPYRVIIADNDIKLGQRSVTLRPGGTTKIELKLTRKQPKSEGGKKGGGGEKDEEYGGGLGGVTDVRPGDREMERRAGGKTRPGQGQGPAEKRAGDRGASRGGGGGPGR